MQYNFYLLGSIIFLIGSIAYTADACMKSDKFKKRNLGYLIGSILFVIGSFVFILDALGTDSLDDYFWFGEKSGQGVAVQKKVDLDLEEITRTKLFSG